MIEITKRYRISIYETTRKKKYPAERTVILKPSPGRLATILDNDPPRPRARHSPEFLAMKARTMQEMQRHGLDPDD
jgi:ABC-type nitrate/sulfonate/bicarbonate transport system ATPase subunit